LSACATTGPTNKVEKPARPQPSEALVKLLKEEPPPAWPKEYKKWFEEFRDKLQKEFSKFYWEWHGYADKMEMRAGYK